MNAVHNFASHSFSTYATKNIRIDEDHAGLFASVPSSDGRWYTVRCVEGKTSVYASHCTCSSFARHQHCTHIETVQRYYGKFYKPAPVAVVQAPVVVEAPVKKTRKPRNGLVRKVRGGGLVKVEQHVEKVQEIATALDIPVAEVATIAVIAADYQQEIKPKHTEMTLPIGPRDTKKDIIRKSTDISNSGHLYSNKGFSILR